MSEPASQLAYLRDPRLSGHAIGAAPVWLWTADATRILWANAIGAAIFEAPGPSALSKRIFSADDPAAVQIARVAGTLPPGETPRLERLRGFGAGFGRALTCACSRITLPDRTSAILVVAGEAAGPSLPLAERVRRVVAEIDAPIAVFSAEGALLHAAAPALDRLTAVTTLSFLGADALATHALRAGSASGPTKIGPVSIERIGSEAATALIAILPAAEGASSPAAQGANSNESAVPPAPPLEPAAPAEPAPLETAPQPPAASDAGDPPLEAADTASEKDAASESPAPAVPAALPERRHPLRFVWRMDTSGRFSIESGDFIRLTGRRTADLLGRPWNEIATTLGLDPKCQVAHAIATRDTWSGITIDWPVDDTMEKLAVELSGLPIFDRDRAFGGYRGFGVCRNAGGATAAPAPREADAATARADAAQPPEAAAGKRPAMALPAEERPVLTIVPPSKNVVPFRASMAEKNPSLSPVERKAFRELARQLTTRLQQGGTEPAEAARPETDDFEGQPPAGSPITGSAAPGQNTRQTNPAGIVPQAAAAAGMSVSPPAEITPALATSKLDDRAILDHLPVGVLVYRLETLLYANRAFLDWTGHDSVDALADSGGLDYLFVELRAEISGEAGREGRSLTITTSRGNQPAAEARLLSVPWEDETAHVLMLLPGKSEQAADAADPALRIAQAEAQELKTILDTATDGVLVLDREGKIVSANRSAEALFGYDSKDLAGSAFAELFAPESQRTARDYLAGFTEAGVVRLLNEGREAVGRVREGGLIPLFMSIGRLTGEKLCVVLRDVTPWKKTEEELINAKQEAEKASSAKSDFLAKISHEIRTPLNAIIGFSEVMMGERFGPIANDRYREYLKDIHESGGHLVSLLNDLLDLSKIEAGKVDLTFTSVNVNELTQQCVALMQPQANQQRIIIRTSLPAELPPILADARSVRQIALNLLSNSIKFTGAGGQVIVSTALTDDGGVMLRVRDTGLGMSEKEVQMALEPFRQLATSARWGSGGTGLGLPLTKALAEANRARFTIKSAVNAGTLVEILFPRTRVLAQ
jgi:PAS domain S-box-containing protein